MKRWSCWGVSKVLEAKPSLSELIRWRLALDRRIAKRGVEHYLSKGMQAHQIGERWGQKLQRTREDLITLIQRERLTIVKREEPLPNPLGIRAWLDTGRKEILLFMPVLKSIEEQLPWTAEDLVPIALAHEFFHYLQSEGKIEFLSSRWPIGKRWRLFPLRTTAFDEIAAFGFARGILQLPYSPLVIDYFMVEEGA